MNEKEIPGVRLSDRAVGWITCGSTAAALGLSYRNQLDFASQTGGYPLFLALLFPLIIDSFVVVGELRLFSATARDEDLRIKAWAWLLTLGGLAASTAAGTAHVGLDSPTGKLLAAAVAPLAAAASLGTGLGIVKLRARKASTGRKEPDGKVAGPDRPQAPAAGRRARSRGAPTAEQMETWYAEDIAAGLPCGKQAFAKRHKHQGVTEHQARVFLTARSNGHELVKA